jgi:hypothetical protein
MLNRCINVNRTGGRGLYNLAGSAQRACCLLGVRYGGIFSSQLSILFVFADAALCRQCNTFINNVFPLPIRYIGYIIMAYRDFQVLGRYFLGIISEPSTKSIKLVSY